VAYQLFVIELQMIRMKALENETTIAVFFYQFDV